MQQTGGGGGGGATGMIRWKGTGGSGELIRSLLEDVRPGDLITSEFMRKLLRGLADLEDYLGQLDDSVGIGRAPDVVFLQLPRAVSALRANDPALTIEGIYDTFGNKINPADDKMRGERIVLAQFPVPGAKITGDRSVKLVVSTEANRWIGILELLADRGPGLLDYWQKSRGTTDTSTKPHPASNPIPQSEAAPEAVPATDDPVATKTARKARARRKSTKTAGG